MRPPLKSTPAYTRDRESSGITLNMIVKNEAGTMPRLIESVRDVIDYYVISDTGSTDETPELITKLMAERGIPGEVHFEPWVNFGHNRQRALDAAIAAGRSGWLLFIDADEELASTDREWFRKLVRGTTYRLQKHHNSLRYALNNLVWLDGNTWSWHGPVHEYVQAHKPAPAETLENAWIIYHAGEGARSRGVTTQEKFLRDAAILEDDLVRNPNNPRNVFYLAQSYRDAGELPKAYSRYVQRAEMGQWPEEVFVARLEAARLGTALKIPFEEISRHCLKGFEACPHRAETLWHLAALLREQRRFAEGYIYAKTAKDIPYPTNSLFVRRDVYTWQILDEFSICAYWIGSYDEAAAAGRQILDEGRFPESHRTRLEANLKFALDKINARSAHSPLQG